MRKIQYTNKRLYTMLEKSSDKVFNRADFTSKLRVDVKGCLCWTGKMLSGSVSTGKKLYPFFETGKKGNFSWNVKKVLWMEVYSRPLPENYWIYSICGDEFCVSVGGTVKGCSVPVHLFGAKKGYGRYIGEYRERLLDLGIDIVSLVDNGILDIDRVKSILSGKNQGDKVPTPIPTRSKKKLVLIEVEETMEEELERLREYNRCKPKKFFPKNIRRY